MKILITILFLLVASGCGNTETQRLEKENKRLKTEIENEKLKANNKKLEEDLQD